MMRSHVIRIGAFSSRSGVIGALLLSAALAAACSTASSTPSGGNEKKEAKHAMHLERLRQVMKTFDTEVRRNVATEVDAYARWEGVFPEMTDAAEELEASAIQLSGHPPSGLELPDRGRFQVLARSLATAAGELRDAAARNDADAVESARIQLGTACRDCHERFRPNSPGVPDAFR
jgi:curli biogenesis system outer membrane secretion channel CsgG